MKTSLNVRIQTKDNLLYGILQQSSQYDFSKVSHGGNKKKVEKFLTEVETIGGDPYTQVEDQLRSRVKYFTANAVEKIVGFDIQGYEDNLDEIVLEHVISADGFKEGGHLLPLVKGELVIKASPKKIGNIKKFDMLNIIKYLDDEYNIADGQSSKIKKYEMKATCNIEVVKAYDEFINKPTVDKAMDFNHLLNSKKKESYLTSVDLRWEENREIYRLEVDYYLPKV